MKMKNSIRIATRGSKLAIVQTNLVINLLKKIDRSLDFQVIKVKTSGDNDTSNPLFMMDRRGIFEKEVNEYVLSGRADFAVHSIKDVPTDLTENLIIASIPKRESPNDVLITRDKILLKDLPSGSKIGTSSLRRAVQLKNIRSDLEIIPIRGNVETRIGKVMSQDFDGIILAEAGIKRINLKEHITQKFNIKKFLPAPGQGALAIVTLKDNHNMINILKKISHHDTELAITAERSLIKQLEGGCRFPIGAIALVDKNKKDTMTIYAKIFSADGKKSITYSLSGNKYDPVTLGKQLGKHLLSLGAKELSLGWEKGLDDWNKRK